MSKPDEQFYMDVAAQLQGHIISRGLPLQVQSDPLSVEVGSNYSDAAIRHLFVVEVWHSSVQEQLMLDLEVDRMSTRVTETSWDIEDLEEWVVKNILRCLWWVTQPHPGAAAYAEIAAQVGQHVDCQQCSNQLRCLNAKFYRH